MLSGECQHDLLVGGAEGLQCATCSREFNTVAHF